MQDSILRDRIEQRHGFALAKRVCEGNDIAAFHAVMVGARQREEHLSTVVMPDLIRYNDMTDLALYFRIQTHGY